MKAGLFIHLLMVSAVSALAYTGMLMDVQGLNIPGVDKALHFFLVGGIAFWWTAGWNDPSLLIVGRRASLVLLVLLTLATGEETLQALSPFRDADPIDWLANVTGVVTFWWLGRRWLNPDAPASVPS